MQRFHQDRGIENRRRMLVVSAPNGKYGIRHRQIQHQIRINVPLQLKETGVAQIECEPGQFDGFNCIPDGMAVTSLP